MSDWQQGRRRYGPHCEGKSSQQHKSASWDLRFLQFERGEAPGNTLRGSHIELAAHGMCEADKAAAQAACDAQAAAWQVRFPGLLIVDDGNEDRGDPDG